MSINEITVRGARQHNLKNINVEIPRNKFTVVTGLSGSGKSSLAFDTIYAEGRRRYVESMSAYARQFLDRLQRPDVESIDGLAPAVAIEQRGSPLSPRSTVATATELHDHLRLLFARVGTPHCPTCGAALRGEPVARMVDRVLQLPAGRPVAICAPVVRRQVGDAAEALAVGKAAGLTRAVIDG